MNSAVMARSPVEVAEPSDKGALRFTVSLSAPPSIVTAARKAASTEDTVTVSIPVPALMVSVAVGLAKVTDSPSVEAMVQFAPAASVKVIVSPPPVKLNTRSAASMLSVTGSNPV